MAILFLTGGNRGIGKSILKKFAENHFDVVVSTRKQYSDFEEECRRIEKAHDINISHVYMDLGNQNSIRDGLNAFNALNCVPNVVVNNAGIFSEKTLMMTPLSELENVFQVNYFSVFQICQYLVKKMLCKGGSIINISSIGGMTKQPLATSYGASKAALNRMTTSLAQELAPFKIRVNAVAIGSADSDMVKTLSPKSMESLINATALKRTAKCAEIADVVYYLSSSEASFINGQIVRVDGGLTL